MKVQHVRGHTGFAQNELVDIAAKAESNRSRILPRQDLDLTAWKTRIPFLWMIVSPKEDLPQFTTAGFNVQPIDLPQQASSPPAASDQVDRPLSSLDLQLSMATANVCSLYSSPDGHAGKLDYLREQFHALKFNFRGIQEARSTAGMSASKDVLRLSTGHQQGTLGVELWISLCQPIGYKDTKPIRVHRKHIVVLHAAPRILLVKVERPDFPFVVVVGHAPHCGHPDDDRSTWWQINSWRAH